MIQATLAILAAPREGGNATMIFMMQMVAIFAIFYFLLIRPQRKEQERHKTMISELKKGDEIQTMGGMMGKVTELGDNFMKVEIADNVIVTVRKTSVEAVMPKGSLKEM